MNASSSTYQRFVYNPLASSYGSIDIDGDASVLRAYLVKEDGSGVLVGNDSWSVRDGMFTILDLEAFNFTYGTDFEWLFLERSTPLVQTATFQNGRYLDVRKVEAALDNLSKQIQDLSGRQDGTVQVPLAEKGQESLRLPSVEARKGMVLGFDADGNFTTPYSVEGLKEDLDKVTAFRDEARAEADKAKGYSDNADLQSSNAAESYRLASGKASDAESSRIQAEAAVTAALGAKTEAETAFANARAQVALAAAEVPKAKEYSDLALQHANKSAEEADRAEEARAQAVGVASSAEQRVEDAKEEILEEFDGKWNNQYLPGLNAVRAETIASANEAQRQVGLAAEQVAEANKAIGKAEEYASQAEGYVEQARQEADKAKRYYKPVIAEDGYISWVANGEGMEPIDGSDVLVSKLTAVLDALEELNSQVGLKIDGAYVEDGYLTLTSNGVPVVSNLGPFSGGGGGGGGSSSASNMSISSLTGWTVRTFSEGSPVKVRIKWTSTQQDGTPTGAGSLKVAVNGKTVLNGRQIDQLEEGNEIELTQWLSRGNNSVIVTVIDVFGTSRSILFSVTLTQLQLTSRFDESAPITGDTFRYTFTPTGKVEKTMHFLIDDVEVATLEGINASGSQQVIDLVTPAHGGHVLETYFTCEIDGAEVESPRLRHCLICVRGGADPVIVSTFVPENLKQYDAVNISFYVYDPNGLTADVTYSDGTNSYNETALDRTLHTWTYIPESAGSVTFSITSGATTFTLPTASVEPSEAQVEATEGAVLYLTARNKVSSDRDWTYGDHAAWFDGFNWISNGWMADSEGYPILRLNGNAKVLIDYDPFDTDLKGTAGGKTGRTIEFEFSSSNAQDYDAVIMSCMKDGIGFEITPQSMTLKSLSREITRQYKENEHVRVTMVIESLADYRLIYIYLNGILCGIDQYPTNDTWLHPHTDISIGSDLCTTDIYSIRCYDKALSRREVLNNYLSDIPNAKRKVEEYFANQIFDEYGAIDCNMLPSSVPYVIIRASRLSENKKDELECSVELVTKDEAGVVVPSRSFTIEHGKYKVQGTSSEFYMVKNFKFYPDESKDGRYLLGDGTSSQGFKVSADGPEAKVICLKADYASSEGANNVVLAKLFEDINPYQTAPQQAHGSMVRQGIDGFPCAVFFDDGTGPKFYCKANFNIDKDNPEIFGFTEGDESWETKTNNGDWARFINTDFSNPLWKNDFEARYPEKNEDTTNLQTFAEWVASTDTMKATGEPLADTVVLNYPELNVRGEYSDYDHIFTEDTAAYRLAKFRTELAEHASVLSSAFYFVFTEFFLMIDSRVKNSFPTFFHDDPKWMWPQYDMDTAMGINNNGVLVFGYNLESEDNVFNGHSEQDGTDSVFWRNFRQAFAKEIQERYNTLRQGKLSYDLIEERFEKHQSSWPVAMWNEDAYRKYIAYITEDGKAFDGDIASMCQGSKADQRKFWLYGRTRYEDSKYMRGDPNSSNIIRFRGNAIPQGGISIVPYIDMYVNLKAGEYQYKAKASKGEPVTIVPDLTGAQNTDFTIFTADQIKSIGDISGFNVEQVNVSEASRLQELVVGSSKANTKLNELGIGNNPLLRKIDAHNCPNLKTSIDATNCPSLVYADFSGTSIKQLQLANGGIVETLRLPDTIEALELINQPNITTLQMPGFQNIRTLRCEGMSSLVNSRVPRMFNDLPDGAFVRVLGFDLDFQSYQDAQDLVDNLARFQGIDENGVAITGLGNAQVSGTIRVPYITASQKAALESYGLNVIAEGGEVEIAYFCNWDGTILRREFLVDGSTSWTGSTPQREPVGSTGYTFKGWTDVSGSSTVKWTANTISGLSGKDEYYFYACYSTYTRQIVATFFGFEGVPLSRINMTFGYTPNAPVAPTIDGYSHWGWNPPLKPMTEATDYYAVYNSTPIRSFITNNGVNWNLLSDPETFAGVKVLKTSAINICFSTSPLVLPDCETIESYPVNNPETSIDRVRTYLPSEIYAPKCTRIEGQIYTSPSYYLKSLVTSDLTYLAAGVIPSNISNVRISPEITYIGGGNYNAISKCSVLSLSKLKYLGDECGTSNNENLIEVYLPELESVSINGYNYQFANCQNLVRVNLPKLTSTTSMMFSYCYALKEVVMPAMSAKVAWFFSGISSLDYVELGIKELSSTTFANCSISYLWLPNLTYLSSYAFYQVRPKTLRIGSSVNIVNYVFSHLASCLETLIFDVQPSISFLFSSVMTALKNLYLGSTAMVPIGSNNNAWPASIENIYVRPSLIGEYLACSYWSKFHGSFKPFDYETEEVPNGR